MGMSGVRPGKVAVLENLHLATFGFYVFVLCAVLWWSILNVLTKPQISRNPWSLWSKQSVRNIRLTHYKVRLLWSNCNEAGWGIKSPKMVVDRVWNFPDFSNPGKREKLENPGNSRPGKSREKTLVVDICIHSPLSEEIYKKSDTNILEQSDQFAVVGHLFVSFQQFLPLFAVHWSDICFWCLEILPLGTTFERVAHLIHSM